ncbi:MAG: inositol monophosphatase [Telmatospirillum sp.]|nr:inositol monophosphatase [Telmatospirillum sp.]
MISIEIASVTEIMRSVARGIVLPRFRRLADGEIREKNPGDLVTIADTEAEEALTGELLALLPGSRVVGEESVAKNPRLLESLSADGPIWILDPIDGTGNFVKGSRKFAMVVALVIGGRTVQGWILDPLPDVVTVAELGGGVWRDGRRLSICAEGGIGAMTGSVGPRFRDGLAEAVGALVWQRSAAHDYLGLCGNELQFAYFHRLHPWDHAAGTLMYAEAGGHGALLSGEAYRPLPGQTGLLLASDRQSWDALRPLILC